jgi:hypothetical protein
LVLPAEFLVSQTSCFNATPSPVLAQLLSRTLYIAASFQPQNIDFLLNSSASGAAISPSHCARNSSSMPKVAGSESFWLRQT